MTREQKMMQAIAVARQSLTNQEFPVGAVIFHNEEIISKAHSSGETSNIYLQHAEMKALLQADLKGYSIKQRKEMELYVTLEPCMMCLGAAMSFFIGSIYYSLDAPIDGATKKAIEWDKHHQEIPSYRLPKIYSGILVDNNKELIKEYMEIKKSGPLYDFSKSLL